MMMVMMIAFMVILMMTMLFTETTNSGLLLHISAVSITIVVAMLVLVLVAFTVFGVFIMGIVSTIVMLMSMHMSTIIVITLVFPHFDYGWMLR